ncbi:zinc finger bed domain-containing protein ricesleeper 2-like [Hordeum vulgare]|nr:zinc finger bed domain-containing protein ricesleeper 2-like [Hordeum vulgare]
MLESAIPFRSAFDALVEQDKDYEFCPTPVEWKMAEAACKLLKGFYTATNILSRSNYPTSHLYFPQLCKLKKILKRDSSSKNSSIVLMVQQMEIKLQKYWKESYMSICVPVVFDPRFKFDLLEYMLKDFGSEAEANEWKLKLKKAIQKLFDEYSREIHVHQPQEDCGSPSAEEDEEDDDPLVEWDHYISCKKGQANNELDQYLKEELYPRKKELDILEWWKINSPKYPVLSTIAHDVLDISASTVPSESAFSSAGRIVSDYRRSISCSTVEALVCLQDWVRTDDPERYEGASLEPE